MRIPNLLDNGVLRLLEGRLLEEVIGAGSLVGCRLPVVSQENLDRSVSPTKHGRVELRLVCAKTTTGSHKRHR